MESQEAQAAPVALEAAHVRNQAIHRQLVDRRLNATSMSWMPDYHNYYPRLITRLQELYKELLADGEGLKMLAEEGILEITLRSRTRSLVWPVDAETAEKVGDELTEALGLKLDVMMGKIVDARGRLANQGEGKDGSPQEWEYQSAEYLALLLDPVPEIAPSDVQTLID